MEVFEDFTDKARKGVVLGQEEASLSNAKMVGTEHILVGLTQLGDELIDEALAGAGFVPKHEPRGTDGDQSSVVHLPFTQEAVEALRRSRFDVAAPGDATELRDRRAAQQRVDADQSRDADDWMGEVDLGDTAPRVRPAHVLLSLLHPHEAVPMGGSAAIHLLQGRGVNVDQLRKRVIQLLQADER